MTIWIKDGKFFDGILELDGAVIMLDRNSDPDPELMRRAGYTEYVPPAPEPEPKRYSKLKIIRALGDNWPEKKAELEAAELYDQFMAAQFLAEDDPAFAAAYASLSDGEKAALEECLYE